MKKTLLVVIDALASRVVRPAIEAGRLPTMQKLASAGRVDWNCTAIFPSITPAATAAIVTGEYPCGTGISGAYFYDHKDDRVHYYGEDTWPILRRGFTEFFEDFLVRLNRDQLRCETTFETVERHGLKSACLNFLWFRGDVKHKVQVPWMLRLLPWMPHSKTITGPSLLSLGDFVSGKIGNTNTKLTGPGGPLNRFGFNDAATGNELLALAKADAMPEFTVAYFPNNDFDSHAVGPQASLSNVEGVDSVLGELAETYGGVDAMLKTLAIVITGDHSQTDMLSDSDRAGVQLDNVLEGYNIVPAGADWRNGDELMICPNMRAAQIYLRPNYWKDRDKIIERLFDEDRIDQIIWRDDRWTSSCLYRVLTKSRGSLAFSCLNHHAEPRELDSNESGPSSDEYGNLWQWKGDLSTVDGEIDHQGCIRFGDYPNAFERIANAFDDEVSGDLWLTCKPGHEFKVDGISIHKSGSHGSLHADDSLSPLILAGIDPELMPRATPRSVDITPLCLAVLGIESRYKVGDRRSPQRTGGKRMNQPVSNA
jgi:hypothetical protein